LTTEPDFCLLQLLPGESSWYQKIILKIAELQWLIEVYSLKSQIIKLKYYITVAIAEDEEEVMDKLLKEVKWDEFQNMSQ